MSDPSPPPPEVLQHAAFVRRLAIQLLRDDADADDAAQETLAKAIERPPRPGPGVRAWLAAVLRNVVRRGRRTDARVERRERFAARSDSIAATDDAAARREIFEAVTDAVRGLEPTHREVVLLRHYEGLAPRDIAARLGHPVATVKSRLARAHDQLRARLDEGDRGNVGHWRAGLILLVGMRWLDGTASASVPKGVIAMGIGAKSAVVGAAVLVAALTVLRFGGIGPNGPSESDAGPGAPPMTTIRESIAPRAESAPTLAAAPAKASAPNTAVERPTITGRVVDAKGNGVAGARVVSASDTNSMTFSPDDIGTHGSPGFVTTADADGRFVVDVDKSAEFHTLWADANGYALTPLTPATTGTDVTITLDPSLSLVGAVTDLAGTPITGARVRALWLVGTMKLVRETESAEGGTYRIDDLVPISGPGHPFHGAIVQGMVEVRAEGYAPLMVGDVGFKATSNTFRLDLSLSRGAHIVGKVLGREGGLPVGGATVVLCGTERSMGITHHGVQVVNPFGPRALVETTSAADGSFSFDHVPCKGPHPPPRGSQWGAALAVSKGGFAPSASTVGALDDGATVEITLSLWPSAAITGRVVEVDGTLVSGVSVSAWVKDRSASVWLGSLFPERPEMFRPNGGSDGRFRIDGIPASGVGPTDVIVSVIARESSGQDRELQGVAKKLHGSVEAGKTIDMGDIVFAPAQAVLSFSVLVRSADGSPVVGAVVDKSGYPPPRTDRSGELRIRYPASSTLPTPKDIPTIVRASGFAPTPVMLRFFPLPGAAPQTFVMASSHRIEGRVVVPEGVSPVGISVTVGDGSMPVDSVFPPRTMVMPGTEVPDGRSLPIVYASAQVDTEGRFILADLPNGPYHVAASRQRRVPTPESGVELRVVVPGVRADSSDIVLRFPVDDSPATGSISGRTIDRETGKRLSDPTVTLLRDGKWVRTITADRPAAAPVKPGEGGIDGTGLFSMSGLATGLYQLVASAGGHRAATTDGVDVRDGETTTLPPIALERGTAVAGRVRGPDGIDWTGQRLRFARIESTATDVPIVATVTADGSYRAAGFDAGTYDVSAPPLRGVSTQVTYLPSNGERLVVQGGAIDVRFDVALAAAGEIVLRPGDDRLPPAPWDVKGTVPDAQVKFGAATRVTIRGPAGQLLYDRVGAVRHGDGSDSSLTALPGRYVARIEYPGGASVEEQIDLVAGARTEVPFGTK